MPAMTTVNMLDAKTRLSQLVEAVESGAEAEILIARNGKPAARLVPIAARRKVVFGVAKGRFTAPEDINADDDIIAEMFTGPGLSR
jgi:prevent-host-death family protein